MDISARNAARECYCGPNRCGKRLIWLLAALLAVGFGLPARAQSPASGVAAAEAGVAAAVPLPRPRPPTPDAAPDAPAAAAPAAPPEPSACRLALTEAVAIAPSIPPVSGPGECGGDDLVRLEAVVLPDKSRVAVKPAAVLRCRMAAAVADWIREDIAALAAGLGTAVSELDNFDSFSCRGRNRVAGAKLSEHGRANALDVRGVKLANGKALSLTDRDAPREAREKVLASVCARFTTVLGPGSDGYHEDHVHLDLAERRNGYRICQWIVHDPVVATPLPQPRPEAAPSRETAARDAPVIAAPAEAAQPAAPAGQVEEVKVQPATPPPPPSLSPVPLARQPADVAKPLAAKPAASKSATAQSAPAKPKVAEPPPPMRIAPDAKPAPKPSAQQAARRKTARAKPRRAEPDLPRVLRRIFE